MIYSKETTKFMLFKILLNNMKPVNPVNPVNPVSFFIIFNLSK
jgi:hypothetical protein